MRLVRFIRFVKRFYEKGHFMNKKVRLDTTIRKADYLTSRLEKLLNDKGLLEFRPQKQFEKWLELEGNGFEASFNAFVDAGFLAINKTLVKYPIMVKKLLFSFYQFIKDKDSHETRQETKKEETEEYQGSTLNE